MPSNEQKPSFEREQTDESLRAEREHADGAIQDEQVSEIDQTADVVISRARARADDVLAKARAKTDRHSSAPPSSGRGANVTASLERERDLEDRTIQSERADADEVLREERAAHAAILSSQRAETDNDLSSERARSDVALATRDEFLGMVSHDLRNLLGSIDLLARLIADEVLTENHVELVIKHAQRIQGAGSRMNRLIGDLVDVASIEAGVLAVTCEASDPALVVTEAVNIFQAQAAASGVSLETVIVPPAPGASFDAARVLQVLINLISNALKFTPAKGTVVVSLQSVGDDMRFDVRDSGEGIPAEKLEAIFERFVQLRKNDGRGVGLGLFISNCIVHGHGGRIWAESKMGEGSTFSFTLPRTPHATPSSRPAMIRHT